MNLAKLLDRTATVTPSGGGTPPVNPPVACSIAPADPATVIAYAQQGITCVNLIYSKMPLGAGVGDHVNIGGVNYPVVAARSFSNAKLGITVYVTACGVGS